MSMFLMADAAVQTLRISIPTVLASFGSGVSQKRSDERLVAWSTRLFKRAKADVQIEGLESLEGQSGPFVVVSNHQSHYDIPALYMALPFSLRMAAKKELFKTPIWGRALAASGFVEIDRSSPKSAFKALRAAGVRMKEEHFSLFVAPEGTRSLDGTLGKFKRGAFDVAKITKLPILPVAIDGTRHIHAPGSRKIETGCTVKVKLLAPIPPAEFNAQIGTRVRDLIADALAR